MNLPPLGAFPLTLVDAVGEKGCVRSEDGDVHPSLVLLEFQEFKNSQVVKHVSQQYRALFEITVYRSNDKSCR
jgi:hypothetical protein